MISLIEKNIDNIRELCKKYFVRRFDLVGSAMSPEDSVEEHDMEFLYRFKKDEIAEANYADNYFELLFALRDLLQYKLNLIPEERITNPFLLKRVNENRIPIYEG